ncbi:MAG: phosphatidate cytidylyltransferase [Sphingobacteriales bacterium]|nr:MAG: phosphatidate cytidylyltransferase [Sphingobacteriales bacterium]
MALHWPTFFTRLGSAIVFSAIMMAGLLWNEWAFLVLSVLILTLCLRDYFRLIIKIDTGTHIPQWLVAIVQISCVLCIVLLTPGISDIPLWPALLCVPTLMLLGAVLSKRTTLSGVLQTFGGIFYIAVPVMLLYLLRLQSICIPLALVLMIWMNDTMAYLVGSFIGKTPFSPISPKKTWEGTAGGAILTIAGAAIWGYFTPYYHMVDWMVMALCASVAGTAGDLLESKLKRLANVKDSGTLMPGHGGALDRFDSLLVATPFVFAYAYIFMPALPMSVF